MDQIFTNFKTNRIVLNVNKEIKNKETRLEMVKNFGIIFLMNSSKSTV